jgi:hypothetical protein
MSRLQNLGSAGEGDGIEDAEFVEIDDHSPLPPKNDASPSPDLVAETWTLREWVLQTNPWTQLLTVTLSGIGIFLLIAGVSGIARSTHQTEAAPEIPSAIITSQPVDLSSDQPVQAASVDAQPAFNPAELRKGQKYSGVRKLLMANGFEPAHYDQRNCSPYDTTPGAECFDRPEITECSGTGQGFCVGYWLQGDRVLSVVMADGPDGVFDHVSIMTRNDLEGVLAQDSRHLVQ